MGFFHFGCISYFKNILLKGILNEMSIFKTWLVILKGNRTNSKCQTRFLYKLKCQLENVWLISALSNTAESFVGVLCLVLAWHFTKDAGHLERVERTGTRMIKSLENMTYRKDEKNRLCIFKERPAAGRSNSCNRTFLQQRGSKESVTSVCWSKKKKSAAVAAGKILVNTRCFGI